MIMAPVCLSCLAVAFYLEFSQGIVSDILCD